MKGRTAYERTTVALALLLGLTAGVCGTALALSDSGNVIPAYRWIAARPDILQLASNATDTPGPEGQTDSEVATEERRICLARAFVDCGYPAERRSDEPRKATMRDPGTTNESFYKIGDIIEDGD